MLETLPQRVNDDPLLRRVGRHLHATVLLDTGTAPPWIMVIRDGAIETIRPVSPVMESFTLALRFEAAAWAAFLTPLPPPGYHDLMALLRFGRLRVEGDLTPYMRHLFWFKGALATLRQPA